MPAASSTAPSMRRLSSFSASPLLQMAVPLVLVVVMHVAAGSKALASLNGCNVTDAYDGENRTVDLRYTAGYGTVNVTNSENRSQAVYVSLCVAQNVTVDEGGAADDSMSCGPAYLALLGDACATSILWDTVTAPLAVVDNRTTLLQLGSTGTANTAADVYLVCQSGLEDVLPQAKVQSHDGQYLFRFVSERFCAGFTPSDASPGDTMMSKGAIVAIIIGIVAFVVLAAALLQWNSKRGGDDEGYRQI